MEEITNAFRIHGARGEKEKLFISGNGRRYV
jgi:hypothetical protein